MRSENRLTAVLRGLFFPPKCAACGEFLREHLLDTEPRALCESCRRKWEYAKLSVCKKCGEERPLCRCVPKTLKNAGAAVMLKAVSYDKNRDSVARRSVLFMKRRNSEAVFDFFSDELVSLLQKYLDETYTDAKDIFVTYVPRGRENLIHSGVDQSELLAKGVADKLGCGFGRLLERRRGREKEQKRLHSAERFSKASQAFRLAKKDLESLDRDYRCLALVDDVVTTGASLSAGVHLLREHFHGRILCLSLAETEKS